MSVIRDRRSAFALTYGHYSPVSRSSVASIFQRQRMMPTFFVNSSARTLVFTPNVETRIRQAVSTKSLDDPTAAQLLKISQSSKRTVSFMDTPRKSDVERSFHGAVEWMLNSGIQDVREETAPRFRGGVGSWFDVKDKNVKFVYAEITGYAKSCFSMLYEIATYFGKPDLAKTMLDRAQAAAEWSIQAGFYRDRKGNAQGLSRVGLYFDDVEHRDIRLFCNGIVNKKYFETVLNRLWGRPIEKYLMNRRFSDEGSVEVDQLRDYVDFIWRNLQEEGYIDEHGEITNLFIGTHLHEIKLHPSITQKEREIIYEVLDRSKNKFAFLFDNGMILIGFLRLFEITHNPMYLEIGQLMINSILKTTNRGVVNKTYIRNAIRDPNDYLYLQDAYLDPLIAELRERGYIDENGKVQSKFKNLKNCSEMRLNESYAEKKREIFDVIKLSYMPVWAVYDMTRKDPRFQYITKDEATWSYVFGSYHAKVAIGLLKYWRIKNDDYERQSYVGSDLEYIREVAMNLLKEATKLQNSNSGMIMAHRYLEGTYAHHHSYAVEGLLCGMFLSRKESDGTVPKQAVTDIFGDDTSWEKLFDNPEDEGLVFKSKWTQKIRKKIPDPEKRERILHLWENSEQYFLESAHRATKWILSRQLSETGGVARYYDALGNPMLPRDFAKEPFESSDIISQTLRVALLFRNLDRISSGLQAENLHPAIISRYRMSGDFDPVIHTLVARLLQYQNMDERNRQTYGGLYYGAMVNFETVGNIRNEAGFREFIERKSGRYIYDEKGYKLISVSAMTEEERDELINLVPDEHRAAIENLFNKSQTPSFKPHINSWCTMFGLQSLEMYIMHRNMYIEEDNFMNALNKREDRADLINNLVENGYISETGEVLPRLNSAQNENELELDEKFGDAKKEIFDALQETARIFKETRFPIHRII